LTDHMARLPFLTETTGYAITDRMARLTFLTETTGYAITDHMARLTFLTETTGYAIKLTLSPSWPIISAVLSNSITCT